MGFAFLLIPPPSISTISIAVSSSSSWISILIKFLIVNKLVIKQIIGALPTVVMMVTTHFYFCFFVINHQIISIF